MGFIYKKRKWRDQVRARYTSETGSDDYSSSEFSAWVDKYLNDPSALDVTTRLPPPTLA